MERLLIEFRCLAIGEAEPRPGREPCLGRYSVLLALRRGEPPSALVCCREGKELKRNQQPERRGGKGAELTEAWMAVLMASYHLRAVE